MATHLYYKTCNSAQPDKNEFFVWINSIFIRFTQRVVHHKKDLFWYPFEFNAVGIIIYDILCYGNSFVKLEKVIHSEKPFKRNTDMDMCTHTHKCVQLNRIQMKLLYLY